VDPDTSVDDEQNLDVPVKVTLNKMWNLQKRPQMMILTLFFMMNAFLQAVAATSMYKIIENTLAEDERAENMGKVKIALCFIGYGICGVISGHVLAKILDKFARKWFVWFTSVGFTLNLGIMLIIYFYPNYFGAYWPTCILGLLESGFGGTATTICGKDYKGTLESFNLFKFHQCLWTCLPSLFIILMPELTFLYVMIGMCGVMTIALFFYKGESAEYTGEKTKKMGMKHAKTKTEKSSVTES